MQKQDIADAMLPALVGIGGINSHNAHSVVEAGADSIAVISGLFDSDTIQSTAQQLSQLFQI